MAVDKNPSPPHPKQKDFKRASKDRKDKMFAVSSKL